MASPEEIMQKFFASKQGRNDYLEAIRETLMFPESISLDDEKGVIAILKYAEEGLKPEEFQHLLQDLFKHVRHSADTASVSLLNYIENMGVEVVEDPVGQSITMSEDHAAVHPGANPSPDEPSTMSNAERVFQKLEKSQRRYMNFEAAITGLLKLNVGEEELCVLGRIQGMAKKRFANDPARLERLIQVVMDLLDCTFETEEIQRLVQKTISGMIEDVNPIIAARNTDPYDAFGANNAWEDGNDFVAPGIGSELLHLLDTKIYRAAISFGGRETRLYLTTHSEAPLIVTLLNGLAVSDQGRHVPDDTADTISMDEMLDVVIETWEANLTAMHMGALASTISWEELADYLDCSVGTAKNAGENGQISMFLDIMRRHLLVEHFLLPNMPDGEEALSRCRQLFAALELKFEEMTPHPCVTSSPHGPKQMALETLDRSDELRDTHLLAEGDCGSVSVRAEDTENALKRKASSEVKYKEEEDEDAATNRTLVKEQGPQSSSHTSPLAAKDLPGAEAPVARPGSEVQGVDDAEHRSQDGVFVGPTFHAAPGIPMLDEKTFERLKQVYCNGEDVRTFLYTAKRQGTLHVMAGFGDDLFVLNQTDAPKENSLFCVSYGLQGEAAMIMDLFQGGSAWHGGSTVFPVTLIGSRLLVLQEYKAF